MFRQALNLWKQERSKKGTTLQRRLIIFFAVVSICVILVFAALLLAFGITGNGGKAAYGYVNNELTHLHEKLSDDMGRLSVQGVAFSQAVTAVADTYFQENNIAADDLASHPELLEGLLSRQMQALLNVLDNNSCGGAFILLDASVAPEKPGGEYARAGMFLKKTQPVSPRAVEVKKHYLRGPAQIARDNGIELLGQWKMEFNIEGEEFFTAVIDTARDNPQLPLSRLYYWTGRVTLKDNSSSGFLLCIPMRSQDGAVFGVCGIELSDMMFKQLYTPNDVDYGSIFSVAAPCWDTTVMADKGMIAGNSYLTASQMEGEMSCEKGKYGFYEYRSADGVYGGVHQGIKVYPALSPYESEKWAIGVMMPYDLLKDRITGSTPYFLAIILVLIVISLGVSVFISRRYLLPVTQALDDIKKKNFKADSGNRYLEINDLMEFLASQDEEAKNRKIAISAPDGDIAPMFDEFLKNVETLSPAEKGVFDLYLKGYNAREIAGILYLSINTIKTHNRRIFTKLNVSSRKELNVYINMMKELNMISEV